MTPGAAAGAGGPAHVVYTVGHSTRTWADFRELLRRHGVGCVADVRTYPGSRRFPHFNADAMRDALGADGIRYEHVLALGGRRRPRPDAPASGWRNEGFRGYADHMRTAEFRDGIARLLELAAERPAAAMCSEAVPWRCHRSLLADALVARGVAVLHILDQGERPHELTRFARVVRGEVCYDADLSLDLLDRPASG